MEKTYYKAIFAAGCFWHVQEVFDKVSGVIATVVGYAGGEGVPSYDNAEALNYAEAIKISFDPRITTYSELLEFFWKAHDPTSLNSQGADVGRRYRSTIFFRSEKQKNQALASREAAQKRFSRPIVTEITPEKNFYPAEEEHQKYFEKNVKHFCGL
jgi:peptide-methionine (S)-S-oxide reductase